MRVKNTWLSRGTVTKVTSTRVVSSGVFHTKGRFNTDRIKLTVGAFIPYELTNAVVPRYTAQMR